MTPPQARQPAGTAGAQEVLVVDDNPATRYATSRVLQAAGFHTREAGTGGDALQLADAGIAAVVLDVHLPDLDGFEVCRALRNRPDTARVPVIYLSAAYVRDLDKVRGLHSGADAYMTHPAEPALLIATVQALVRARSAEDGMRRSEARFRALFDQAPSGICLIDSAGRFTEVNRAMLVMLQLDPEAVVGRRVIDLAPPDWSERIAQYLGQRHQGVWRGEFPLIDAHGQLVHLEWSLSGHIEPGVSMAIASNISERVALSQQREQLLEREQAARAAAERISRTKDEFIAVLSHELRTPLNAILGWVHVLRRTGVAPELTRGLEAIERNAKTQTRLISDILDMSRMDLGKLHLELETVDPAELVRSAVSALNGSIRDKSLSLMLDIAGTPGPLVADPSRLQQIVWNLLTNAIKFSREGGAIQVRLREIDGCVELTVRDEGQGIKPEFLPYLFDRFTQSDSASNRYHGGLGLGLSIVKHLVELHGGSVRASSDGPGTGASFVVTLPTQRAATGTPRSPARPSRDDFLDSSLSSTSLTGLTVLAVEDDAEAREMLGIILGDRGARVVPASSYADALRCIEQARPDVLLSDIGLPGHDGYALIREVRRREGPGAARLPAIALTAFARAQDRELALAAGFDAHCSKPLRPHELIAAILQAVRPHAG
ncbi:response regulator [Caldimonas brevitalea]|uniref:histidine kinase n=1 Tax=Caldimonas brevitalea TaxID=413882 RepID=A0A0G3BHD8_9BURK|nr:response regulator [Caldimonas brevitalea]AKJ27403.1 histidine kinase [Caldimonas brevitalea]